MLMEICGIIVPRQEHMVGHRHDGYLAECVLPMDHISNSHVVKTPEGRYFVWENDYDCDCCDDPSDSDHCYAFKEIQETEFLFLRGRG